MKIAILGIGLIGGSIGLAARSRSGAEVCGYDPDTAVGARALELGAIDSQAEDVAGAVRGADVVFACAPIGALSAIVRDALAGAGPDCVVSDVGSTKRALAALAADERFVGGHPLAGAETAGVAHARADLFEGATWYLTPAQGTSGVLYERLHRLLVSLGAQPTAIDAELHDRLMACFSHLPHVLANLLVARASARVAGALDAGQRLPAAGPSFRDATRVAGANTAIWRDIYISNREALIEEIDGAIAGLREFRGLLAAAGAAESAGAAQTAEVAQAAGTAGTAGIAGTAEIAGTAGTAGTAEAIDAADGIRAWNERAREQREALLGAGIAGGPVYELRVSVPNRPGVIAELALALGRAGVNIVDLALSPSVDDNQGSVALWVRGSAHTQRASELIAELGFPVVTAP